MSAKKSPRFYLASEESILRGDVTDVYFLRAREVLSRIGASDKLVTADVHSYGFPEGYGWAVLAGVEEVVKLLEGRKVDVYSMNEGELFRKYEPVMEIRGPYIDFGVYESAILGILRHGTSVATKAARIKLHALDKSVIFFGIRCVHPAITPFIDRAAFIGGCDGVSGVLGASMIGEKPTGTMPHALILVAGNQRLAWKAFDETMPSDVPRIALCDTFLDEREESLLAAETLGERLYGVRLDTPGSRRGNMRQIAQEVRWALNLRGHRHVKILISGGIDEDDVVELHEVADGFGVGTSIAFPKSIDLALDIVEVNDKPISKRGKFPGSKQVYRCPNLHDAITPRTKVLERCPRCGEPVKPLIHQIIRQGELVVDIPSPREIRSRVLEYLEKIKSMKEFDPMPILIS
jgi:nicotinate phosphoribosyltransferase